MKMVLMALLWVGCVVAAQISWKAELKTVPGNDTIEVRVVGGKIILFVESSGAELTRQEAKNVSDMLWMAATTREG